MVNALKIFGILFTFLILTLLSCSSKNHNLMNSNVIHSGAIIYSEINEASGIALSRTHKDVLWIINDSGNSASIFAVNPNGDHLGTLIVEGVKNHDWEDMASFVHEGKPYLLVGDIGDNKGKRKECYLHIIREPDIDPGHQDAPVSVKPEWSITYQYEDGPRDCESVAVDVASDKIILLSKRDNPPALYEISLKQSDTAMAKRVGEIKPFPQPRKIDSRQAKYAKYITQPTSIDISNDGQSMIVQTYANAFYFRLEKESNWLTLLSTDPKEIVLPYLKQAESVCFNEDGSSIYVTSEKIPAPLLKVNLDID